MLTRIRHAFRQLRDNPGFAATAILTLALGIGAATAIFAVLDAVLLEPLPFSQPDRLVAIQPQPDQVVSIPQMQDYVARSRSFAGISAYLDWSLEQDPKAVVPFRHLLVVSQSFFSTLGLRFEQGSALPPSGNEADCPAAVVVSGAYWRRLGGGPLAGHSPLRFNNQDFRITGVVSRDQPIEGELNQPDVFLPVGCYPFARPTERGSNSFYLLGRLQPGVTRQEAVQDIAAINRTLLKLYPRETSSSLALHPTRVLPYLELVANADTQGSLYLTLAACGLLLAIACANLANLLLARNTRRRSEFAIRATLGATMHQLLQQLLVESMVLVALGATAGLGTAMLFVHILQSTAKVRLPRLEHASISPAVVLFLVTVCAMVTVLLTLLPASRAIQPGLLRDLKGGNSSASNSLRIVGRLLVMAQVVFAFVLVACSGWLVGSVYMLLHQPLGFTPGHLLRVELRIHTDQAPASHRDAEQQLTSIRDSLRSLPGVSSVSYTDHEPLNHGFNRYDFCSDLHPDECDRPVHTNPNSYAISSGFFATLQQSLLQGRDFNDADDGRAPVAIVNQVLADQEWPGQSAIGHRVQTGEIGVSGGHPWATVVGVVGNIRNYNLASLPGPDVYIPRAEDPGGFAIFLMRTTGDPALLRPTVRAFLKSNYPDAHLAWVETMAEEMHSEVAMRLFLTWLAVAFGATALFLSILGIYGLLAYEVSLREKEIGIRLALGSSRERIVTLLLRQEGRWLGLGSIAGLASASAAGSLLRSQFYGAPSTSWVVLLGAALLFITPAVAAIAVPARRASRLHPVDTLRRE